MSLRLRKLIQIIAIALIILLLVLFILLQIKIIKLNQTKVELENKLKDYSNKLDELQYKNSLSEDEYIRRYAREVLGYHSKDEIVFKFDY